MNTRQKEAQDNNIKSPLEHLAVEKRIKPLKEVQYNFEPHQTLPLFVQEKRFHEECHGELEAVPNLHLILNQKLYRWSKYWSQTLIITSRETYSSRF